MKGKNRKIPTILLKSKPKIVWMMGLLGLFLFSSASVHGQDSIYTNPAYFKTIPVDHGDSIQHPDKIQNTFDALKEKYQSKAFHYNEKELNSISWWKRLQNRVDEFLESILPDIHWNFQDLVYRLLMLLGFILFAYIIYRLLTRGAKLTFKEEKEDREHIIAQHIEKKLMDVDLNVYLEDALNKQQYGYAIRYLHLINLKKLSEKGLITWDYKKTNQELLNELENLKIQKDFSVTVRIYEYCWYGRFPVSKEQFQQYRQIFEQLNEEIPDKRKKISNTAKPSTI